MGRYLDSRGLVTLWNKIRSTFTFKVSSSTDNAIVRFDGTSGNIQNSGVTINDSNHVTAAKFITNNGTSSLFVKGDGSVDSTSYLSLGGGTMTGTLTLSGAPSSNLHAATKKYVDDLINALPDPIQIIDLT